MRKYIAIALAAACAAVLVSCAGSTSEKSSSEKSFYDIVEENCEKYGACKDGIVDLDGFEKWLDESASLSKTEFLQLYHDADGELNLCEFPPEKCFVFYGNGITSWNFKIEDGFMLYFTYNNWTLSSETMNFDPEKETPEEFFEKHGGPYYSDADRQLTKEEYFDIVYENAAVNGFYCEGYGEDFDNADVISMENFLASWKSTEGVPLINQFAPELCYMICGSGLTYYHFKIEGDFVLTFDINGIFHSISCMRDGKVIVFDPNETVYDFFDKYSENA